MTIVGWVVRKLLLLAVVAAFAATNKVAFGGSPTAWRVRGKLEVRAYKTFKDYSLGCFSRDGKLLALLNNDYVDVIDVRTWRRFYRIDPPESAVMTAAFSPDGGLLAISYNTGSTSSMTSRVTFRETSGGREVRTLLDRETNWARFVDVSFSPDGRQLVTNLAGVARLFDVATGRELRKFLPPSEQSGAHAWRALLSPDGKWVVAHWQHNRKHYIRAWELATGRETEFAAEVYRDWRFSADSLLLAITGSADRGKLSERAVAEVWEVGTWSPRDGFSMSQERGKEPSRWDSLPTGNGWLSGDGAGLESTPCQRAHSWRRATM